MEFSYPPKREFGSYAQRSVAMGVRGMAASSQQLASLAGYKILARGGNAIDAAVAMVSTLNVVEPHSVGLGGDAFALIHLGRDKKTVGMNASGRAPYAADIKTLRERGIERMPDRGILTVTTPGALHGWLEAAERYGTLPPAILFEDAIHHAEHGFPVTEVIAGEWKQQEASLSADPGSANTFLSGGRAPRPGQLFKNKDLAESYRQIVDGGIQAFYGGPLGRKIAAFFERNNGLLSLQDLRDHRTTWVAPISTEYRGYTIVELPPNGQGITALEMLNIMEGYDVAAWGHNSPEYLHALIEAKKIAFADRDYYITDPEFEDIPVDMFLSKEYAAKGRDSINPDKAMSPGDAFLSQGSNTVYVAAVDEDRNAVSFISSIYMHFGSGLVVDGTGIVLQNRGASFSLDPSHPNHLAPHKRTRHTIIPGMVFKDGDFLMTFGVMGGDMQPQGHTQFLTNLIDFKMNPQEAVDAPRICHMTGMEVHFEDGIPKETVGELLKKGHLAEKTVPMVNAVGGGQAIYLDREQGVLLGASDRRKDGWAVGF